MTSPWPAPNPNPLPNPPCVVPLKPCCEEVLLGEECSCAEFAAQLAVAFARPIGWRPA